MMKTASLLLAFLLSPITSFADWNQWRSSSNGNGVFTAPNLPTQWSDSKNVIWKSPVPGTGNSSPIIIKDKIFLTSSEETSPNNGTQSLFCYALADGKLLWKKEVLKGAFLRPTHRQNSDASPTPVSDGSSVIVSFGINGASWLVSYDLTGKELWRKELGKVNSQFSVGASPVLHKGILYAPLDHPPSHFLAAINPADGSLIWKVERPFGSHNWATPRVYEIEGKEQLLLSGKNKLASFDLQKGKILWEVEAGSKAAVGSPVIEDNLAFITGGYPESVTTAINLKSSKIEWRSRFPTYIPSPVVYKGKLYVASNKGTLACLNAKTGKEIWEQKLRMNILASPFIANELLYVTTEEGVTKIIKTDSDSYQEIDSNSIPGITRSTPSIVGSHLIYRSENNLYRIGTP